MIFFHVSERDNNYWCDWLGEVQAGSGNSGGHQEGRAAVRDY